MSVQDMISDIQNHLNQLSSDELTVIWQLVQLLDIPKPVGQPESLKTQPREWFDAEEFLTWRRTQHDADLAMESERDAKQNLIWN